MNHKHSTPTVLAAALLAAGLQTHAAGETPWPAPVKDWKAPEAGEHPRLFFRKADLPEIRKRVATPEGKAIVKRLGLLLDGKDGKTLPAIIPKPGVGAPNAKHGEALTLWHPAGYGMLYHLTGDKAYANLGKEAMEHILTHAGDIDPRYGFVRPNGALRAGPSLGAVAMGYDLCYDGWDDEFRARVAKAIQKGPGGFALDYLVQGRRHGPHSNHWGCEIGGGALAVLAVWKDPGVDNAKIEALMGDSKKVFIRQLTQGFGDGGMFWEGKGPGGIGSDTAFVPAIQAWKVAGGQDFVSPRPHVAAIPMIRVHDMLVVGGEPWYPIPKPGGYGVAYMGMDRNSDRDGLSRGGQFAQGFGIIPDKLKPAALWSFNHILETDPATRTYDTVSRFPHRAVLALVNWPIGVKEVNPADMMPRVHWDNALGLYLFRNQWTGTDDDIVVDVAVRARDPHALMVWGKGKRRTFGPWPRGATTHFQPAEDGSGTLTAGGAALGVDFSKASGADALIVTIGVAMTGADEVDVNGTKMYILQVGGKGEEPTELLGDLSVGKQDITYDGKKIVFGTMAGPVKLPRLGVWNEPARNWPAKFLR